MKRVENRENHLKKQGTEMSKRCKLFEPVFILREL